jgi:hypothetical protein
MRALSLIPAVGVTIVLAACGSGTAPARPVERVPAAARVLTVTYVPATEFPPPGYRPPRPASVTITDLARVRQVVGLIDAVNPAAPEPEFPCPAFAGGNVSLAFSSHAGGGTLAAVTFTVDDCPGEIDLTIAGVHRQLNEQGAFASQFLRIVGMAAPACCPRAAGPYSPSSWSARPCSSTR